MPKTHNQAAKSTREMASKRRQQMLLWGIFGLIALIIIYIITSNPRQFGVGGGGILVLLLAVRIIIDSFDSYSRKQEKKIRRADRGADAEEQIGDLLSGLDGDFEVLHDVESPYGNIDHVVFSRMGGIFLLETKSHRGKIITTESEILLNGHAPEKDFVAQALKNSYWLREEAERVLQLKPWITPVVVFTNAFVQGRQPVKGVRVINKRYLLELLQKPVKTNEINSKVWEQREMLIASLLGIPIQPAGIESAARYCPKCGAELVKRTAKSGEQAGKDFMVCSKYPECKTAIQISTEVANYGGCND